MLVYGDAERIEDQASAWRHVDAALTIGCDADLDQCQAALLRAYIAAAELVQGVADRSFDARGYDEATGRATFTQPEAFVLEATA